MIKKIAKNLLAVLFFYGGIFHLVRFFNNISGKRLTILTYHRVTDGQIEKIQGSLPYLFVHVDTFEKQLRFLKRHFNVISFADLIAYEQANSLPWNSLIITFDDGYEDFYHLAFPLLKKMNIKATLFLTTDMIGNNNFKPFWWDKAYYYFTKLEELGANNALDALDKETAFFFDQFRSNPSHLFDVLTRQETIKNEVMLDEIKGKYQFDDDALIRENRMLRWEQVRAMNDMIEIGSHTCSHANLNEIDEVQRIFEIRESKKKLEEMLGRKVAVFAYPAGNVDHMSVKLVKDAGYEFAVTTDKGINASKNDHTLKRINLWEGSSRIADRKFSKGLFLYHIAGLRLNFNKIMENKSTNAGKKSRSFMANRKEKINILFIIDVLWHSGGTEKHLYYLTKHLDKDKFNCFVVTFNLREMHIVKELRKEVKELYYIPLKRAYTPDAFAKGFELGRIIRENKIDIVQTFHFVSDTYGVMVSRLSGVKHVISSKRDIGDRKKKKQIFLNRLINGSIEKFITVCDAVGERTYSVEGVPMNKQITIYNGVDIEEYSVPNEEQIRQGKKELGIAEDAYVVGSVSHFRPEKSHDVLLQALKKAQESIKGLRAIIVGEGPLREHYMKYCSNNGLEESVIIVGKVDDVRKYVSVMDVACLVPGSNEGFSNSILEKMAMGKPLIVTDVGGNAEAVLDGENGIVIPPYDYKKLSEAILYLYKNPDKRIEMGKKSRERVEKLFIMEKMIKKHESLYENIFYGK